MEVRHARDWPVGHPDKMQMNSQAIILSSQCAAIESLSRDLGVTRLDLQEFPASGQAA